MNKTGIIAIILLGLLLLSWSGASAATDGFYQLSEVAVAWDGTDANRTKESNADCTYTYGDESSVSYNLPWSFTFYGQSYSQITVDTNGNVWFAATGSAHSFNLATTGRGPVIAAWNNDLSSYYYGGVFIQHKTNPERVVIEWQAETYSEEGYYKPNTFEVVLYPNGNVRIDYKSFTAAVAKDFGSGISKNDGSHYLNLTTLYGNAFNFAGNSFVFVNTYSMTASVIGGNGSITPNNATVNNGDSTTFTLTPATGYHLTMLTDNGLNLTDSVSGDTYTISNIAANHTVVAVFAVNTYSMTASVSGVNGSITPNSATVNYGDSTTFTITPATGYRLAMLTDNGIVVTAGVIGNSYTISNITANHTVVAAFAVNTYSMAASVIGGNGTITSTTATVNYGDSTTFTLTPATGYRLATLTDNGIDATAGVIDNSYTISNITANHTVVASFTATLQIAAGYAHTVALKNDGTVVTWGYNYYGQLGDGTTTQRNTPAPVPGLTGVVSIAAGYNHTVALKNDGTVVTWGDNSQGQLGDGTTTNRLTPTSVPGLTGVVAIAAGQYHTVALKNDGTVVAWGYNFNGQLGDGTTTSRYTPTPVPGLTGVVSIAAGSSHSVALKSDGTLVAWGYNYFGQLGDGTTTSRSTPTSVLGLTGVVSIAAGSSHTVALKTDGTLATWGYNSFGQLGNGTTRTSRSTPTTVPGLTGVVAIAAGSIHTVALKSDGTLVAWGHNGYGQLGDGTTTSRYSPTPVPGLTGVVAIAAGYAYTVALKNDASVLAWGPNTYGQLGDGTTTKRLTPTQLPRLSLNINTYNVISLVSGSNGTITPANTAINTGSSATLTIAPASGYLLDTLTDNGTDVKANVGDSTYTISNITDFHTVVATFAKSICSISGSVTGGNGSISPTSTTANYGSNATFIITPDAGYRLAILLDNGFSVTERVSGNSYNITNVSADHAIVAVFIENTSPTVTPQLSAASNHTVALKNDGTLVAWGDNYSGQLGDGTTTNRLTPTPVPVPGMTGVVAIATGQYHTVALKNDGTLLAWGYNYSGQLGDGTNTSRYTPTPVPGLTGVVAIATGDSYTVALKNDGTLVAWGYNYSGQLGDGTNASRYTPTPVPGLTGVVAIVAGNSHTVALKNDGTLVAWGYNSSGQLGDGTTTSRYTPTPVPGLTGVVAIAAGFDYTVALKNDGTLVAWGYNFNGQLGDGTTTSRSTPTPVPELTGVVAIAAGNTYTVALESDGTLVAWGDNGYGQLGDGTTTSRSTPMPVPGLTGVVAIVAGANHTVVLKSDGTLVAWGNNSIGQLGDCTTTRRNTPAAVPGVSLGINTYSVNSTVSDGNGAITPTNSTSTFGGNVTFTIAPSTGYHLASLTDNGLNVTGSVSGNTYTISNIAANHTVVVAFAINTY